MTDVSMKAAPKESVRFDHVTISFRTRSSEDFIAVDKVNLSIREREFVTLVGPSGCGKSTLLRSAAGLIEPAMGEVRINTPVERRGFARVAIVFQAATLMPWKTALANVLYPTLFGTKKSGVDYKQRATELLHMVGLSEFLDAYPSELSGGMQQRVAICRALILDPDILLMDEPFSALDALTREELQFELRRIHQRTGKTIIFVTHSISESVLLSDRIVVMAAHPGRLKDDFQVDLPAERTEEVLEMQAYADCVKRVRLGIYGQERAKDDVI